MSISLCRSTDEQQRRQLIHPFHDLDDREPNEEERDCWWTCRNANELWSRLILLFQMVGMEIEWETTNSTWRSKVLIFFCLFFFLNFLGSYVPTMSPWCVDLYGAWALHLGCHARVGYSTRLGHFYMHVPAVSCLKKKKFVRHGNKRNWIPFHKTKRAFML